jgi:hypothetical protein
LNLWTELGINVCNFIIEQAMFITCQLCNQTFGKQITNKHLKYKHGISTAEYKDQFGLDSLSSPEYRAEKSSAASGANNPMFGKTQSDAAKASISGKNQGKTPHNKGKKVTEPDVLLKIRAAIVKREEQYRINGNHPRLNARLSDESKSKISAGIKEYAKDNRDELTARARKGVETKIKNGHFDKMKFATDTRRAATWEAFGYSIQHHGENITVTHNACGSQYQRNRYSIINPQACTKCFDTQSVSSAEMEIRSWLESVLSHDMIYQDRSLLSNGFEIDILIPELKIAIEYNGLYWHSEEAGKSQWYHATKHNKCAEAGIRLIQIFEDEWLYKKSIVKDRLIHILKLSNVTDRIFARDCKIVEITPADAKKWHENHHIQGRGTGTIAYALKKDGNIKAVMDFARPSRAKGYKGAANGIWELTRFSVEGSIPGAASRLFKAFIRNHDPVEVISYSDRRWNTGTLYEKLGFERKGTTLPNYWYVSGDKRYHRYKFRKDQLIKEGFDPTKTEKEIMKDRKYKRIWDCGNDKWVWSKK